MRGGMLTDTQTSSGVVVWGQVKWYDAVKGYGFVVPDGGGPDIMVHASCVRGFGERALGEGARVQLGGGQGEGGQGRRIHADLCGRSFRV